MTTTTQATKPRYRVPSVSVDADVSLDEFDNSDIIKYLRHQGYEVGGADAVGNNADCASEGLYLSPDDLGRIETLALCGQKEPARQLALEIISEAIGREL